MCVLAQLLSLVWLCVTPWTMAHQAPLSVKFSRQEYWSEFLFPIQGNFLSQELNPCLLLCRQILYHCATCEAQKRRGSEKIRCQVGNKENAWRSGGASLKTSYIQLISSFVDHAGCTDLLSNPRSTYISTYFTFQGFYSFAFYKCKPVIHFESIFVKGLCLFITLHMKKCVPADPALFVEKTVFVPLYCHCSSDEDQLTIQISLELWWGCVPISPS